MQSILEALIIESSRKVINEFFSCMNSGGTPGVIVPLYANCSFNKSVPTTQQQNACSGISSQFFQNPQVPILNGLITTPQPAPTSPSNLAQSSNNCLPNFEFHGDSGIDKSPLDNADPTENLPVLYSWCLVDLQNDGDCKVAGLLKTSDADKPCEFFVTSWVTSVSSNGNIIHTSDYTKYRLDGPLSWSTFRAFSRSHPTEIPSGILTAFSCGFPKSHWRNWTQGLHYFLFGPNRSSIQRVCSEKFHVPKLIPAKRNSTSSATKVPSKNRSNYDHILKSYKHNVDLDVFLNGAISGGTQNDISTDQPEYMDLTFISSDAEEGNKTVVDSHVTSVSELSNKRQSVTPKRGQVKNSRNRAPHNPLKNKSVPKYHKLPKLMSKKKHIKSSGSLYSDDFSLDDDIEQKYRLYTASGRILDARCIGRTRSGRWVVPTLDSRYSQSIILEHNRVLGVSHNMNE